jgi:hypothetical protein
MYLILEVKGQLKQQDTSKEIALEEWIAAVNQDKRFGKWSYAMSTHPKDLTGILSNAVTKKLENFS